MSVKNSDIHRRLRHTEELLKSLSQLESSFKSDTGQQNAESSLRLSANLYKTLTPTREGYPECVQFPYRDPDPEGQEEISPSLTVEDLSHSNDTNVFTIPLSGSRCTTPLSSLNDFDIHAKPSSTPNKNEIERDVGLNNPASGSHHQMHSFSSMYPSVIHSDKLNNRSCHGNGSRQHADQLNGVRGELSRALGEKAGLLDELHHTTQQFGVEQKKVKTLMEENDIFRREFPLLKDQMSNLKSQNEAHHTDMRKIEERYEKSEHLAVELKAEVESYKAELAGVRRELKEEAEQRRLEENAHSGALSEVEELQGALKQYQRKAMEKIAQMEETEKRLRESAGSLGEERDHLLESVTTLQAHVHQIQQDNRKLREHKLHHDSVVPELEHQLSQLTHTLGEHEMLQRIKADLEAQLTEIQRLTETQRDQLGVYRQHLRVSSGMLAQLEKLVEYGGGKVSSDNSIVSTVMSHNASVSFHQSSSFNRNADHGSLNIDSHDVDAFTQRYTRAIDGVLTNMVHLVQRQKHDEEVAAGLEEKSSKLRDEKLHLHEELTELRREAADRDAICTSLEARLKQRDIRLVEVQNENSHKSSQIGNFEKELRKRSSVIMSLEGQLDEKVVEYTRHVGRLKELEDDLITKEGQLSRLRKEMADMQKQLSVAVTTNKTLHAVHSEFYEFQRQIDQLHVDNEAKNRDIESHEQKKGELEAKLVTVETDLKCVKEEFKQTEQDLADEREHREGLMAQMKARNHEVQEQITQLQDSLVACKQQIKSYTREIERSRITYNSQVDAKNKQIALIDQELKNSIDELERKEREVATLEKGIKEAEKRVHDGSTRFQELVESERQLKTQVRNLEKQLARDKSLWVEQTQDLTNKLEQTTAELGGKTQHMDELIESVQKLQEKCSISEADLVQLKGVNQKNQAEVCKEEGQRKAAEVDLRKCQGVMEQHIEHISDLEDQLHKQSCELDEHRIQITQSDTKIDHLQMELNRCVENLTEYKEKLQHSRFEVRAKEQLLADIRDTFQSTQEDLVERQREVEELQQVVSQHRAELQKRTAQVTLLDETMQAHQREVEIKVKCLEEQIQSTSCELDIKNKQVTDLGHRLSVHGNEARESKMEVAQLQQSIDSLTHNHVNKLKQMHEVLESRENELSNKGGEYQSLYHDITHIRQELQEQEMVVSSLRHDLQAASVEKDRLNEDLNNARIIAQRQHAENEELSDKLQELRSREVAVAVETGTEVQELRAEADRQGHEHQNEVAKLQSAYTEAITMNEELAAQLRLSNSDVTDLQRRHATELHDTLRHNASLQAELLSRKTLLETANQTLVVKDAEIARLHAKISSFQRDVQYRTNENLYALNDPFSAKVLFPESRDIVASGLTSVSLISGDNPKDSQPADRLNSQESQQLENHFVKPIVQNLPPNTGSSVRSQHNLSADSFNHVEQSSLSNAMSVHSFNQINTSKKDPVRRSLTFTESDSDAESQSGIKTQNMVTAKLTKSSTHDSLFNYQLLYNREPGNSLMSNSTAFIPIPTNSQSRGRDNTVNPAPVKPFVYNPATDLDRYVIPASFMPVPTSLVSGKTVQDRRVVVKNTAENYRTTAESNKDLLMENYSVYINNDPDVEDNHTVAESRRLSEYVTMDENPVTAVQAYQSPLVSATQTQTVDANPPGNLFHEQHIMNMDDIQRRLETNQRLQAEIDRQLISLDSQHS